MMARILIVLVMIKIAIAILLSSFFLLRPLMMQDSGLLYPNDDFDYFAHATSLVFGQFPSYKNEFLFRGPPSPEGAIGAGIMAAPFVYVFSWVDRINGSSIVEKRTLDNVRGSWTVFGFIFAGAFYFCLSCLLLFWSVRCLVGETFALWAVILMIICQGMPLYAFRRPIFTHSPELFLQSVFVYLFIKNELSDGHLIKQWWAFICVGVLAGMIALTRYNNILFTISWPLLFLSRSLWPQKNWRIFWQNTCWVILPIVFLISIFKYWPELYNHYIIYKGNDMVEKVFNVQAPWQEFVRRLLHIFLAFDWGLIFTAPFLLLGCWGMAFCDVSWKRKYIFAMIPLLVNCYVVVVTGSQGAYYGYRYLIASAFPLFVLPLAFLLKWLNRKIGNWWKWGVIILAVFPVISMWCYEGNAQVATYPIPTTFFGTIAWGNATYQIAVWQTVLNLKALGGIVYLGGIQYFHQLLFYATATSLGFKVTPPMEIKTLIQVLLIYSLPFVLVFIFKDKALDTHDPSG